MRPYPAEQDPRPRWVQWLTVASWVVLLGAVVGSSEFRSVAIQLYLLLACATIFWPIIARGGTARRRGIGYTVLVLALLVGGEAIARTKPESPLGGLLFFGALLVVLIAATLEYAIPRMRGTTAEKDSTIVV